LPTRLEDTRKIVLTDVISECEGFTSLWFVDPWTAKARPGQYVMAWIPGLDEVPMSLSAIDEGGRSSITVRAVGEATEALSSLEPGDRIGVRGPYGNGYRVEGRRPILVAGGSGASSLMPLVRELVSRGAKPTFILGARSSDQLMFLEKLEKLLGDDLVISTDDGSRGYSGYASGYAAKLMEGDGYDQVYTCGPELMMARVFMDAEAMGLPVQASLERFIKCSAGLCGACAVGPYRVCVDGPVFDSGMLREVRGEFGVSKMDLSGKTVRVDH
jgi:dihydroorotate dehydrogenase electron transfer subunit